MNIKNINLLILLILGVFISCSGQRKNVQNSLAAGDNAGFRSLIQDDSTAGWHTYLGGPVKGWKVEDGVLFTPGKQGDIVTDAIYENFELSLEWKIESKGNSGVFYNVVEDPANKRMHETGPEFQIIDDENYPQELTEQQKTGALSDVIAPNALVSKKPGEWNHTKIVVSNGSAEHWLNGKKILAYDLNSETLKGEIAKSKFSTLPSYAKSLKGRIGLQDHGGPVYYRNIKIKVL